MTTTPNTARRETLNTSKDRLTTADEEGRFTNYKLRRDTNHFNSLQLMMTKGSIKHERMGRGH